MAEGLSLPSLADQNAGQTDSSLSEIGVMLNCPGEVLERGFDLASPAIDLADFVFGVGVLWGYGEFQFKFMQRGIDRINFFGALQNCASQPEVNSRQSGLHFQNIPVLLNGQVVS